MRLTDEQRALLAEQLAELMLENMDMKTMERMVYDFYLDEYIMMDEEDLLVEADMYEVGVPNVTLG
jgi:hypothetical protein